MKKKTEIAENLSSGAEKVETIQKQTVNSSKGETQKKTQTKSKTTGAGTSRTVKTQTQTKTPNGEELAKKESEKAKKRVELALKKKEEQAKKAEERKKLKAERKKIMEQKRAERKKAMQERKQKLAEELDRLEKELKEKREAKKRARAEKKSKTKSERNKSKKENSQRKSRGGYGGWLAAVIALGAVTLALTAVVTVGAVDMTTMTRGMLTGNKATLYEFVGVMENVDEDLDRVRVSASPVQQDRILTDLLVQARVAETDLEKLPLDGEVDKHLTEFINRTARTAEELLAKLRRGERLTEEDWEKLEELYEINHGVRAKLDKLSEELTDSDWKAFFKGAKNRLTDTIEMIENATLPENAKELKDKLMPNPQPAQPAQPDQSAQPVEPAAPTSRTTTDDKRKGTKIASEEAAEIARKYFTQYDITDFRFAGETLAKGMDAYNFVFTDKDGVEIFAQVSERDGKLIRFDYYKDCKTENFDGENARRIAEEYLEKLGYHDMSAVRLSEGMATASFTFVKQVDGVFYYPQEIRVKVCEERGVVSGFDASQYLKNKRTMAENTVKITKQEAQEKLHEKLIVNSGCACVIEASGRMLSAYEFTCQYDGKTYLVYINAETGDEISVYNAENLF